MKSNKKNLFFESKSLGKFGKSSKNFRNCSIPNFPKIAKNDVQLELLKIAKNSFQLENRLENRLESLFKSSECRALVSSQFLPPKTLLSLLVIKTDPKNHTSCLRGLWHIKKIKLQINWFQTTITYICPANTSLPTAISSNFSFDYSLSAGFIYNVTAYCEIDQ